MAAYPMLTELSASLNAALLFDLCAQPVALTYCS